MGRLASLKRGAWVPACAFVCVLGWSAAFFASGVAAGNAPAEPASAVPGFEIGGVLGPESEPKVDRILILKSERRMILLSEGESVFEYSIALGGTPEGPKRKAGDQRTPEGNYSIDWRKSDSAYHLALHVSYPDEEDRREARSLGVDPGGEIMIHGLPSGLELIGAAHRLVDWTDGCIAVTNEEMDELWRRIDDGVAIEIRP